MKWNYDGTEPLSPQQEWVLIGLCFLGLFLTGFGTMRLLTSDLPVTTQTGELRDLAGCSLEEERERARRGPYQYWLVLRCGETNLVYAESFGSYYDVKALLSGPRENVFAVYGKGSERGIDPWLEDGEPIIGLGEGDRMVRDRAMIAGSYLLAERLKGGMTATFGIALLLTFLWVGWHSDRLKRRMATASHTSP
jgi:hypothetical protein